MSLIYFHLILSLLLFFFVFSSISSSFAHIFFSSGAVFKPVVICALISPCDPPGRGIYRLMMVWLTNGLWLSGDVHERRSMVTNEQANCLNRDFDPKVVCCTLVLHPDSLRMLC